MNDAPPRFAVRLAVTGLGVLAALGCTACGPDAPKAANATSDGVGGPLSAEDEAFRDNPLAIQDPQLADEYKQAAAQARVKDPPAPLIRPTAEGRPVEPGESVPVVLAYQLGAEAQHRITVHTKTTLRNDMSVSARRLIFYTKSKVTESDGSGRARIRFELTRMRYAFPIADSGVIEIDSAEITDAIGKLFVDNPQIALAVLPDMATLGKPVEFKIGKTGRIESVEGVQGWADAFTNAIADIDPNAVNEAPHKPTAVLLADTWAHYLFPAIGGGEMKGGETRNITLREDTFLKMYAQHPVRASVTHVTDGTFTIEGISTAEEDPQTGGARSPGQEEIVKTKVLPFPDSGEHLWDIDVASGFVNRAFHRARFQVWVSYGTVGNPLQGASNRNVKYSILEREINVERDDAPAPTPPDEPADPPEETGDTGPDAAADETASARDDAEDSPK